jgi:hypothetical protein
MHLFVPRLRVLTDSSPAASASWQQKYLIMIAGAIIIPGDCTLFLFLFPGANEDGGKIRNLSRPSRGLTASCGIT